LIFLTLKHFSNSLSSEWFGFISWNNVKMSMKDMLTANLTAIPTEIVPLRLVFIIYVLLDLLKKAVCSIPFLFGQIKYGFPMFFRDDYTCPFKLASLYFRLLQLQEKTILIT